MDKVLLEQMRHDRGRLIEALREAGAGEIDGRGRLKCPFHPDRRPSASVRHEPSGWRFKCFGCEVSGDFVEVLSRVRNTPVGEVLRSLTDPQDQSPRPRKARPAPMASSRPVHVDRPTPDRGLAYRIQEIAIEAVLSGKANSALRNRGITREWITENPVLGFIPTATRVGNLTVGPGWVLRIVDSDGDCFALKLHRETGAPKCQWLPIGTEPAKAPRHGWLTLWPPPEWAPEKSMLFLTEGELKAAAIQSAGRYATSPTGGSSFRWMDQDVERLRGRKVCLLFDDDEAGHGFRDATISALSPVVDEISVATFGGTHG